MRAGASAACRAYLVAGLTVAGTGCGIVGPSCIDEDGTVVNVNGHVAAGATATYTVVSPKSSNLLIRLTWPDSAATLGVRATITACGGHVGCSMDTFVPPFGPGGSSPIPQPWPTGLREMVVDGWQGKTYRVEITSDRDYETSFTLQVTYQIHCES
jgi:hypothetical protein